MRTSAVNSKYIFSQGKRFEGKFYLNENSFLSMEVESRGEMSLPLSNMATVFNPPVFKRQFCKPTLHSVPYFQSSDVPVAEERSQTYVFKGQAESLNLLVKRGDILVTGFGTIGNTRLVSKFQNGTCYANNVCRIRTNDGVYRGDVYAFLSSKFGVAQLNKNASGSVVRYIEAPGIRKTLVPNFPESFQKEVDDLIQESARLREEATEALEEAKRLIIEFCNHPFSKSIGENIGKISSSRLLHSLNARFDAPVFINDGVNWVKTLSKETVLLGDCNIRTWYPGMFKRSYVKNGYPYIKGSELFLSDPFRKCEQLSRSRTPKLDELWLKEGQLLLSCAGVCGLVKLITKEYDEKQAIGSPDIIRLVSDDSLFTKEYLFAYLQIPAIYDYMQSLKYGSVIERFDISNIETIPVVKPTLELSQMVTEIVMKYADCTYKGYKAEEKAISMVEKEIEKWNN